MRGGNRTWMTLSAQRRARQLGRSGAATRLGAASPRGGDPARRSGELPLRACGSGAPPRPSASRGRSALCQPRARAQLLAGRAPRWPRSGRRWGPEAGAGAGGAARGPAGAASAAAGTPRSLSMKTFRCCFKYPLQQKVFVLFLTLWLFSLLKLLNEPLEIGKSLEIRRRDIIDLDDDDVGAMTSDCDIYQTLRRYHQKLVSREEKSFPIAYSLVVHKDAIMVERLIQAIYNRHNIYCIHYDRKSPEAFKVAMNNLAKCFSNIFIASKLETVQYAHISRLQADLNCLSDLLRSSVQWKYVINLCGQDFPLKSNFELVSELKKLNGANMLETVKPPHSKIERFTYRHELRQLPYEYVKLPVRTNVSKDAPPHDIEIFVGSAYFVLSRAFVKYVFNTSLVKDFFAWSEDTYSPDEHFWATLIRVPGVPGEISRSAQDVSDLQSKTRLVKWNYHEGLFYPRCTGSHLRSVCIYGAAELRWLIKDGHWFANKFDSKVDPVLIKCLAEKLEEQQREWITLSSEM
ncbi:beta-1,3-galactosyl-O-glycosyl-glycoprotein beta-1,6-N-acetylglucosaminyltransferase 4 isoform X2 [Equus quagga]|uniref:beta-1,3-galactosyl-O-glycosyl-glycoprotein beta-1,6-N-acetylglucosaminyltransferase 4 isoform X2 n=1 Tax=Equus quagga TaxID=89248 RepID=UPI001EE2FEB4|nr:beta-1,3-galactosyl-O-glycosyl-glycoprotein beta-1,6-N-acetylglucosaminyltransferase 4 isoform X2 [Equus quagga]